MQTTIDTSKLPNTAEERVLFTIINNDDAIHNAVARTFGLSAWFKAYTQSEEFAKLSKEFKAEAFETYENLKYTLQSIESETDTLSENAKN